MKIKINENGCLVWTIRGLEVSFSTFDQDFFPKLMKFARCRVKKHCKKVSKIGCAGKEYIAYSEFPNGHLQKTAILEMRRHSDGQLIFNLGEDFRVGAWFHPRAFREQIAESIADLLNEEGGWMSLLRRWTGSEQPLQESGDDLVKKYDRLYSKLSRPRNFKPVK